MSPEVAAVDRQLRDGRLRFTLGQAAASTGLSIDAARDALDRLLRIYGCRVQLTDSAEIVYDFGPRLRRIGEPSFEERLRRLGNWSWRGVVWAFRLWLTGMLVCYFVAFALLASAMLLASMGGRRDHSSSRGLDPASLARVLRSIFRWRTHTERTVRRQDDHGYPYRRYEPVPSPNRPAAKGFVASVHDFVLGPQAVPIDAFAQGREVAAFTRREKGILVATDLVALAGWTADRADRGLVDSVLQFEGSLEASEGGVIFGRFGKLLTDAGASPEPAEQPVEYWDEYEPEYECTGNTPSRNLAVVGLNLVNLAAAGAVLSGALGGLPADESQALGIGLAALASGPGTWLLGWIPLVFSVLFFVIPGSRWLVVRRRNRERLVHNLRKRVLRQVFRDRGAETSIEDFAAALNRDQPEEPVTPQMIEPMLRRLVQELRGDARSDDRFEPRFAFPLLALELQEAARIRQERRLEVDPGRVILDTGTDGRFGAIAAN